MARYTVGLVGRLRGVQYKKVRLQNTLRYSLGFVQANSDTNLNSTGGTRARLWRFMPACDFYQGLLRAWASETLRKALWVVTLPALREGVLRDV